MGSDRIWAAKRQASAGGASRNQVERIARETFRLKPRALAAALTASVCQAAAMISRVRAHLLPDRSVTSLRQAPKTGHRLGLEYAAKGTREVDGRKFVISRIPPKRAGRRS
jgi:hypothetical protein